MTHANRWAEPGGASGEGGGHCRHQTAAEEDILRTKLSESTTPSTIRAPVIFSRRPRPQGRSAVLPHEPETISKITNTTTTSQAFYHVACIIDTCRTKVRIDLLTVFFLFYFIHTTLVISQISTASVQFYSPAGWQQQQLNHRSPCQQHIWLHIQFLKCRTTSQNTFPTEHDHSLSSIATRRLNTAPTAILKLAKLSARHNYISLFSPSHKPWAINNSLLPYRVPQNSPNALTRTHAHFYTSIEPKQWVCVCVCMCAWGGGSGVGGRTKQYGFTERQRKRKTCVAYNYWAIMMMWDETVAMSCYELCH